MAVRVSARGVVVLTITLYFPAVVTPTHCFGDITGLPFVTAMTLGSQRAAMEYATS